MSRVERRVADWLATVAEPNEKLRCWAKLGYPDPQIHADVTIRREDPLSAYLEHRGLSPDRQVHDGSLESFAILTDHRVLIANSKALKVTPKELVAASPVSETSLEWFDQKRRPVERHLLFLLGDSWYRGSAIVNKRNNIEAFVEALGPAARNWSADGSGLDREP
jgi:hypothetical protein